MGIALRAGLNFLFFALLALAFCLAPSLPADELQPQERRAAQHPEARSDWLSEVQAHISALEYCWQRQATPWPELPWAWQAPNRAHNMRTFLVPGGFHIIPRAGDASAWEWGLVMVAQLDEDAGSHAGEGDYFADGSRFERLESGFSEWFINDERGMEFGFAIEEPFCHNTQGGPPSVGSTMVFEMAVIGTLKPVMQPGGVVEFHEKEGGAVMRLGGLQAHDATGRKLPTRLKLAECQRAPAGFVVQVIVDVADAFYPITIDPLAYRKASAFPCNVMLEKSKDMSLWRW